MRVTDHDPLKKKIVLTVTALAALALFTIADENSKVGQLEQNYYCEMVYLFITSNGEVGFPDYKSQYSKNCEGPIVKPSLEF